MGLFDKKFCDICGDKVNMLTRQKLSDGFLCSDCKHKLGSFTSGWKERTIDDVKRHLELREQNKQKYQQFNCSATAGDSDSSIQVDFNNRWFIFDINNRDNKSGNPQIFDFSQLQDFWLEQEYRTLSDSDHDGIPDIRDKFDNSQLNNQNNGANVFMNGMNQMFGNMQTCMVNVPLAAQQFLRNTDSGYSSSGSIKEVSGIKACFSVTDPYITKDISFTVAYVGSNNQRQLMEAYETGVQIMQLCMQIKQGGVQHNAYGQNDFSTFDPTAPKNREEELMVSTIMELSWLCTSCRLPNDGTVTCIHCGKPISDEHTLETARKVARCKLFSETLNTQSNSVPTQQSVPQSWTRPSCGAQNSGKFCESCGTPKP